MAVCAQTVRALRISRFGGPDVLELQETPTPAPGPGTVRVEVHAGGLNFADTERRRGLYLSDEPLPETLGFEGAGVVEALGPDVEPSWLGKRVAFFAPRAHAEACLVPVERLIPIPDELSFTRAAAFPVQGLTAWHVLHTLGSVKSGEQVLVHSAAGGVGQWLVQLAREAGAQVIGTVSRDAKHDIVRRRGAQHVLTRTEAFREALARVAPRGVDLVLEGVGGEVATEVLHTLAPLGRWVTYGNAAGPQGQVSLEALFERSLTVKAFWLRTPLPPEVDAHARAQVLERWVSGRVDVEVTICPWNDAARAHRRLEAGLTTGKWVFQIRP